MKLRHLFPLLLLLLLGAASAFAATYSVDQVPNVQLQDHTRHFSNPDGIVSASVQAQIDSLLMGIRRATTAEVAVVAVDDIDSDDPEMFATRLFTKWGLGKSDRHNGMLVLVVKDKRYAVLRTGFGAEGVMPDITAGQIRRNVMFPYFRNGDFDGGILAGVKAISNVLTDPDAAAELHSSNPDNYRSGAGADKPDFFKYYLMLGVVALVALLLNLAWISHKSRGLSDYQKYSALHPKTTLYLCLSLVFLGIPLPALAVLYLLCRHWRNRPRKCPHCGTRMHKLSEDADNEYLSIAQDLEERIKAVDYDVWLCPKCGETDVYSYVNRSSGYSECPYCHAHTMKPTGTRVLQAPTTVSAGAGEKVYTCLNCHKTRAERYTIPKKPRPQAPIIIPGGGGRSGFGGGFGGGGFGGGFGGGRTGGGGSGGSW